VAAVSQATCFAGPPTFKRAMMRTTFIKQESEYRIQEPEGKQAVFF
jgi:hypothetical protein